MDLYVTFLLELKESIGKQIGMTKKTYNPSNIRNNYEEYVYGIFPFWFFIVLGFFALSVCIFFLFFYVFLINEVTLLLPRQRYCLRKGYCSDSTKILSLPLWSYRQQGTQCKDVHSLMKWDTQALSSTEGSAPCHPGSLRKWVYPSSWYS